MARHLHRAGRCYRMGHLPMTVHNPVAGVTHKAELVEAQDLQPEVVEVEGLATTWVEEVISTLMPLNLSPRISTAEATSDNVGTAPKVRGSAVEGRGDGMAPGEDAGIEEDVDTAEFASFSRCMAGARRWGFQVA